MVTLSKHWSAGRRQLLFIVISVLTAIALSYDYVAATEQINIFVAIVGAGVLLALVVAVPILLFENQQEVH